MEVIVPFRQRHCDEVIRMRKTERKEKKHRKSMRIIALVLVIACLGLGFKTWQVRQEIEEYAVVQEEVSKQISEAEKLQALQWLKEHSSWDAKRWVQGLLFDDSPLVRAAAAQYIADAHYLTYLPDVEALYLSEADAATREQVCHSLERLRRLLPE